MVNNISILIKIFSSSFLIITTTVFTFEIGHRSFKIMQFSCASPSCSSLLEYLVISWSMVIIAQNHSQPP